MDIEGNSDIQTVIICCITIVATIHVINGIKVEVRRLSEICFGIGCILLFTARFADNSWFLANLYMQSLETLLMNHSTRLSYRCFRSARYCSWCKRSPSVDGGRNQFLLRSWISSSPFADMLVDVVIHGR